MRTKIDFENFNLDLATRLINANGKLEDAIANKMEDDTYFLIEDYINTLDSNGHAVLNYVISYFSSSHVDANSTNYYLDFLNGCKAMNETYDFFYAFNEDHTFNEFIARCFELREALIDCEEEEGAENKWDKLDNELNEKVEMLEDFITNSLVGEYNYVYESTIEDKAQYLVDYYDDILNDNMEYETDTMELFEKVSYTKSYK